MHVQHSQMDQHQPGSQYHAQYSNYQPAAAAAYPQPIVYQSLQHPQQQHQQLVQPILDQAYYSDGVSTGGTLDEGEDDVIVDEKGASLSHTGVAGSVFSYVCTCVGAGVLSLPGALQYMGWTGLILMVIVAIGCNHTSKYLIACMFAKPGQTLKTYEEIGEAAMGIWGRRAVAVVQFITLFGVCTIFLILIGGNMTTLVPQLSLHDWIFVFAAPLIPIAWLKTMNEVSYLAIFGVLASLWVAAIVVIKGFHEAATNSVSYDSFNVSGISQCINIVVFSFGGHSVLPNIVCHLKQPKKNYERVTAWSYFFIASVYLLTAAGGYAGWGTAVAPKILDNMSSDLIVKSAYVFITAHVVMAYPIPLNPVSLQLERILGVDKMSGRQELLNRVVLRTGLVLLTVFIASVVPYFGDILQLVSSLSIVIAAFIFPPLFYYLLYRHQGFSPEHIALLVFIGAVGTAASAIGVYYSITGLIDDIKNNPNPFAHYFN